MPVCMAQECVVPFIQFSELTLIPFGYEFHFVSFLGFRQLMIIIIKACVGVQDGTEMVMGCR